MQRKTKMVIALAIILTTFYCFLPLFYENFNYSPSMEKGQPYSLLVWNALKNQRVTLETEVPSIPVNQFPIYQGRYSSNILNVSFTSSVESYDNCTEDLCFLFKDKNITEGRIKPDNSLTDFQSVEFADLNVSDDYIIQQVKDKNFLTPESYFPMVSLGRTKIIDIKFIYFNGFDAYPYRYSGKTIYYPAWKLTVDTSNYGVKELIIKAF